MKLKSSETIYDRISTLNKQLAELSGRNRPMVTATSDESFTLDQAEKYIQDHTRYAFDHIASEVPPDPTPPDPTPPDGKQFPDKNDPMCGVPTGTQLQTVSGNQVITQNGARISGKRYTGFVTVEGDDIEMFNCEIDNIGYYQIKWNGRRGKMHHCTVTGHGGSSGVNTIDLDISYCRIRGTENGINVSGDGTRITWCDITGMLGVPGQAHYDCIQADGDIDGLVVANNRLDCDQDDTSGMMADNYWGAMNNVTIENNYIGGGSYPAYTDGHFNGASKMTNVKYLNNKMKAGGWGGYFYKKEAGPGCVWQGNTDYQTGANVDQR
jgi:hypothetical protein